MSLKAQLQQQQRQRELADAQLAANKARLELAVLLYPDPNTPFTLDSATAPALLPDRAGVETLARQNNPETRSALASLEAGKAETYSRRLPCCRTWDSTLLRYRCDELWRQRARRYSQPWLLDERTARHPRMGLLTTERNIKQSRLRENATKVALTATQRRLIANLAEFYAEADAANKQMASYDTSLVTARESLRLTTLRYVDGESTVLEVVSTRNHIDLRGNAQIESRVATSSPWPTSRRLRGTLT